MNTNLKLQQNVMDNLVNVKLIPCVKHAIAKIVARLRYIRLDMDIKNISTEGGNCLGILYAIDIKGKTEEGNYKETNIFMKQAIPDNENIKRLSISDIYKREVFVYNELGKIFREIQDEAKIPTNKRFKLAKVYEESDNNAIILENMTKQGFTTYGKLEIMSLKYAELSIEQLAKFHGLSFVIERKMPEYYESNIKSLGQPLTYDSRAKQAMKLIYELATKNFPTEVKNKTDQWWDTAIEDFTKYIQGSMTNVKGLCHGDFKMNNVMYKENNGEVAEVITVDYQLVYYGSPILDLLCFIYLGTDQSFRKEHLNHLINHYHASLKTYLEFYGIPVDHVYPRREFEKDFQDCLDYALVSCVYCLPVNMSSQDINLDLGDYETLHSEIKIADNCYERLKGVFDDCFKWDH